MSGPLEQWLDRAWRPLLAVGIALHALTLFGEIPEPDAALYANIARRIAESGDWVNLIAYNVDWLDKPHFPFWVTAASFKLFGVGAVQSRLPALAFSALGLFYTWQLGRRLYGVGVARLAVLVLLSSQHFVMSNADVRAEPFLVGLLAAAVFHVVCAREEERWLRHVVAASAFTAAAMMTKGPFLLFPVACAAVLPALVRRQPLLLTRWFLAIALTAVLISPELISLWLQFDAHPEKVIFERTGVSGLRWFFWDSQFGRFANTGPIRGSGDPTFFFHTVLWSFLPWGLCLYAAGVTRVRALLEKEAPTRDPYSWAAALPTVLLFSASRFQLPHYLNIVFPFFALIVAAWLFEVKAPKVVAVLQGLVLAGMTGFLVWLVSIFEVPRLPLVLGFIALGVAASFVVFRGLSVGASIGRSFAMAVITHLALLGSYNPAALRYQVGHEAAALANTLPPMTTVMVDVSSHAFAFHLHERAMWWTREDLRREAALRPIRALGPLSNFDGFPVRELARYQYFHASRPTGAFLHASTRAGVLETWVLVELGPTTP